MNNSGILVDTSKLPADELPRWDLSVAFYKGLDDPAIEQDKELLKSLSQELSLSRGEIAEMEPYELSIMLRKYESMIETARKLSYYAFLYSDTHKTDQNASIFQSKIQENISSLFDSLGFIHYELNALKNTDPGKMWEFLFHPKLHRWFPWLLSIFNSYWSLSEGAAFIINKKSLVSSQWSRLYDETCASLQFKMNGKILNEAEIAKKAGSRNADIRHKALLEMNRVYKENARVFTHCYNTILKDKRTDDELYGLSEPVQSSLADNNISKVDLLSMVNEVTDSYISISQRFYKLLAQIQHVDHIRYEDRGFNPIDLPDKKVSWPQCVQQVLQAYADFSLEYMAYGYTIISSNTIDVPPQKGKSSGAYCIRGETPYILLNFTGTQGDVATFAHELGHGVHHILSDKVGVLNDSTPTALAEVASEFAENLIFQRQLADAETNKEKLSLLIDRVMDMVNSVHRQVSFYKFEERTHRERKKGELSTERLNQIWREECSRYFGFDIGEDAAHMWMGISHIFDMPYYVYSYAFAGLVVNNLIKAHEKWEEKGRFEILEDFADLYIDMLSNTGVEDFKGLLKPFGIDADDPEFWANGLELITRYIDEIERLAKLEGLI